LEKQVDAILNRKTFKSDALREKTRAALLKTLAPVHAMRSDDEDELTAPSEYRYDDSDGIKCRTGAELEQEQQDKKAALRKQSKAMFSDDEQVDESGGGVAVAVDVNRKMKWGYTALHFAAVAGDEAECRRLLEAGADKTITENGGKTASQKAASKGFDALAALLKP
jgi:hypothetical protein